MPIQKVITGGIIPVKVWTEDVGDSAIEQLENMSKLPFIHKHIAAMPDVHWGMGATIGSVIPSLGAIVPAAVGVDLGCGMMAVQTSLTADDLPDNLEDIWVRIKRAVPHGGPGVRGSWKEQGRYGPPNSALQQWSHNFEERFKGIIDKYPKIAKGATVEQLGTLGGGNHFIEVCLDESDNVWVVLHSGSRGVGNRIGTFFINEAKREMEKYHIMHILPDKDLAYLVEHTVIFNDYVYAVNWAQDYAKINREIMMETVLRTLRHKLPPFKLGKQAINCHHNYIARENHYGSNVIVTRKGAIRAREGDFGIIPGSMGAKTYIVKGKGNKESFCSCSHGAGRKMGRKQAKRMYTAEDLAKQTEGIMCPKDESRVDEIPAAYKDIDEVMENQSDLVDIVHTLHQVINVKG